MLSEISSDLGFILRDQCVDREDAIQTGGSLHKPRRKAVVRENCTHIGDINCGAGSRSVSERAEHHCRLS